MSKVMIITGGSRGIGAATARLAADRGFSVAVGFLRDNETAESLVEDISKKGGKAIAVQGDVASEADVLKLFEEADRKLGRVTALVNNAGIVDKGARVEQIGPARLARMFAVNVTGSFLCAREAIKRMSKRHGGPGGSIVNLSSIASRLGGSGEYVDYAASKGAIDTFTIGLAKEVGPEGIRVNAVRPGIIETDIHASGGDPDRAQKMAPVVPMQRAGSADEVAEAIVWLLSDASSYTTGAVLDVTGGR
jgi:NAD(P)-dependent dehydrogenase (short-subunit alcohol dehydrogenase family)